jgi:penicillin amidase
MEAQVALENVTTIASNFVVIDTGGNIGWFPYNRVPKRTWATDFLGEAHPKLPLDGRCATPERCYEWTEYFDYAELPQALNPSEGFIATANNDMTGHLSDGDPTNDGYPPLQTFVVPGFRHARIAELIKEIGSVHTTDTMHQIQHDAHSFLAELMRPTFIEIAESEMSTLTEAGQKILSALKTWELACPTGINGYYVDSPLTDDPKELLEASGCAAFHAAYTKCDLALRHDDAPRYYWMYLWTFLDPDRLRKGDVYWDDPATPEIETKHQVISECFDEAGELLINDMGLGNDETRWAWGKIQGLVLSSDLSSFGIPTYNNPPPGQPLFTNAGGRATISPTDPALESSGFIQREGSVMRLICEALPSGPACTLEAPGGQSSHIESEHYDDLLFKYLDGEPIDLVFDIEKAKANAVRTVTFD